MPSVSKSVFTHLRSKGISVAAVARGTGIPYKRLVSSLSPASTRELQADEFFRVCEFLEVKPENFWSLAKKSAQHPA